MIDGVVGTPGIPHQDPKPDPHSPKDISDTVGKLVVPDAARTVAPDTDQVTISTEARTGIKPVEGIGYAGDATEYHRQKKQNLYQTNRAARAYLENNNDSPGTNYDSSA